MSQSSQPKISLPEAPFPEWGIRGMATSDHRAASEAAAQVLREGGNAVDAAVTLSLTLGVTCPQYTGIGGGGFALVWLPGMPEPRLFDFRETAPGAAHPDMFGDDELSSIRGGLAPGIPGTVAGMARLLEEFGTISFERALAPGIEMARAGIEMYPNLRRVIMGRRAHLEVAEEAGRIFLQPAEDPGRPGHRLVLTELADTYERLARLGPREFYEGQIAEKIVTAVQKAGGVFTMRDLAEYTVRERTPIKGSYRGRDIYTVGPPSGGGIQLLQMLKMMEPFSILPSDFGSAECLHLQAEAMRLSFADRSSWIADPDFYEVPVGPMLDAERMRELQNSIDPKRAMDLVETPPLKGFTPQGRCMPGVGGTAAYITADQEGGFVSATESVNLWFGSMIVCEDTGILLNDVMDDFARAPGTPDAFGLVSSRINQVEPGKRPASSSSPALLARGGKPMGGLASAGGPRIAPTVFQLAMNVLDCGLNIQQAMDAARIHHQWLPNELSVEQTIPLDVRRALEQRGHRVVEGPSRSHAVGLLRDDEDGFLYGAGDFRAGGAAAGWC